MKTMFLPVIDEKDFEAFLGLKIRDFPSSYAEAQQRHLNRLADYGSTNRIVAVRVDPDEFSRFVETRRKARDISSMLDFADAKGNGKL